MKVEADEAGVDGGVEIQDRQAVGATTTPRQGDEDQADEVVGVACRNCERRRAR